MYFPASYRFDVFYLHFFCPADIVPMEEHTMPAISPVSAASPVQKGSASPAQLREAEAPAAAGSGTQPVVNPSLRFDLKLGVVVLEFFDERGEVANSVPSPQKLKAYEAGLVSGPGFAPAAPAPAPERDPSAGTGEAKRAREGLRVVA